MVYWTVGKGDRVVNRYKTSFLQPIVLAIVFINTLMAQSGSATKKMEGSVHRAARLSAEAEPNSVREIRKMARPAHRLSLGALKSEEARPVTRKPGLAPVGINRALPSDLIGQGEWSATAEGTQVWRLSLTSPEADALRLHFQDFHVGAGKVWLLGTDSNGATVTIGPYSGDGLFGDGEFWTDMVAGDSLIVAYEPADGSQPAGVLPFRLSEVSHRFQTAPPKAAVSSQSADSATSVPLATAATCTLDVSCYADYNDPALAVAMMIFESGGQTYQCTGSLLASASQPALPFFLTANHCIGTPEEARSLITIFKYQTPNCQGTAPSLSSLPRVTGASFIAGQEMALGDYTLLQLSAFPNTDVKVLGWWGDEISANEQVTSISHPRGDYKRIAFGERGRDATVRFDDGQRMPANKGIQVTWSQGVTQGGSSGSPLLALINGSQYLVGTLTGGPNVDEDNSAQVCRASNLQASYGRFAAAITELRSYLTSTDGGGSSGVSGATQGSISANPNPITVSSGGSTGRTTLSWQATGASVVQIRIGSATGTPMTGFESPVGSVQTGDWVYDGMVFYLQDASDGNSSGSAKTLATVRVQVVRSGSGSIGRRSGVLLATPNPVILGPGQTSGTTTLRWQTSGVTSVQIRVSSPTGTPMTGLEAANGSTVTGNWVTNGMTFYLQDASDGNSSGTSKTLSTIRVQVVTR